MDDCGQDKLDLSAIDAKLGVSGNQAFSFPAPRGANFAAAGHLRFVHATAGKKTYVEGNVDAGLGADFRLTPDTLVPLRRCDAIP
jgi:hypothetical protein